MTREQRDHEMHKGKRPCDRMWRSMALLFCAFVLGCSAAPTPMEEMMQNPTEHREFGGSAWAVDGGH
jgi:hypothetical protein